MNKQILVPMKRNDRADGFIPYIEKVARPGMKVVFMVPYLVDGFRWSSEEFGRKGIEQGLELASYYTWECNLRSARSLVASAVQVLSTEGLDTAVELYAGSMRGAIRNYTAKGDVHLIVTRASIGQRLASLFKRSSPYPVLLSQPGAFA